VKNLLRAIYHKVFRRRLLNKYPKPGDYHKIILSQEEGNNLIKKSLLSADPLMVVRFGSIELDCLTFYLQFREGFNDKKKSYHDKRRNLMWENAGFFPTDNDALDAFCELYINCIRHIDCIGVWFIFHENKVCERFCPDAALIPLRSIEPYYSHNPWSQALENKKVLVIHPFQESIESQYRKRERLFANRDVLPSFELITLQAVQSIAKTKPGFETWFDAYAHMCAEMKKIDFDIAIIGAGAYGLPLAFYAKSLGKKAIHMGGATQILFGIKGKRWDQHEVIAKLYNEHWVRPLLSERPDKYHNVEEGCYW
jgi:hypothetical protein